MIKILVIIFQTNCKGELVRQGDSNFLLNCAQKKIKQKIEFDIKKYEQICVQIFIAIFGSLHVELPYVCYENNFWNSFY
jgi:hypothetical protein